MKLALLQLQSTEDVEKNIRSIHALLKETKKNGAEFALLPENAFRMRGPGEAVNPGNWSERDHPGIVAVRDWAKEWNLWILAGSVAVKAKGIAKPVNRSLLIAPDGKIKARYDKIHLFDVTLPGGESHRESASFAAGTKAVCASTPWGKLGMTVCYDVRFPNLYRKLARMGASMIAVPSAFTQVTGEAHWHTLLRARAIENGCYILAPAMCGTHAGGRKTYGHSLVVSPWGEVLADGGESSGITVVNIDLGLVEAIRSRIPSLRLEKKFR